jgi:3-phosphoshikimate 1-carboxyvinyltransferase
MIDEFPIFAVAAAYARGNTVVQDAKELRYKESDRISALCNELHNIGVKVEERPDGFMIRGGDGVQGGYVDAHDDHRLAMSLAVAGLAAREEVTVHGAQMIAESFPDFFKLLSSLGAEMTYV